MSGIDKAGLSQLIIAMVAIITALIWPYAPLFSVSSPHETENGHGHGLSGLPPIIGVSMESEIGHRIEVVSFKRLTQLSGSGKQAV